MSGLLRLLTTGKSLVGLKDEVNRYRLSSQGLLPKFGSARNPFQKTADPRSGDESKAETTGPAVSIASSVQAEGIQNAMQPSQAPSPTPPEQPVRALSVAPVKPVEAVSAPFAGRTQPLESSRPTGFRRLAALFSRGRPGAATDRPVPTAKGPVQYELSLDRVQVVRNDLSDTDLEIVARKQKVLGKALPVTPLRSFSRVPTQMAKATTRLIGALKT